ncbi:aminoglycoside phosphotransferase [Microbacterium chocolatum]|uniref:maltokinase N-terminal cap-like domain-containing protein n=1 Tax=Microbacterium aurantiacum TaxID=162393 RepID=UPI00338E3ED8
MDSTLACLTAWMPRQRWYATKGRSPRLRLVSWWDLPSAAREQSLDSDAVSFVRTLLVADDASDPAVLYQVPVVARPTESVPPEDAHTIGSPIPGTTLRDGPHDAAYADALFSLVTRGGSAIGPEAIATGHPAAPPDGRVRASRVMSGEQSNTSLVYEGGGAMPVICKIYRQLHAGHNPDIELPGALAASGSMHVPAAVGWVEGRWPDPADARSPGVRGSLASAQEFLPGVQDAWRVALDAAASGEDFTGGAAELGAATADVHVALARLFPVQEGTPAERDAVEATWQRRLAIAVDEVPALSPWRARIEDVYGEALTLPWPALQRIHGDYHLGQVLRVPDRGWVLLDFEGEPLRPMRERTLPDLALRDVAGMLRSFDYVAGSLELDRPDRAPDVRDWARRARMSFLEGYAAASRTDLLAAAPLLTALELDKAVYEAIYEVRNRPTWSAIPLGAVRRLIGIADS